MFVWGAHVTEAVVRISFCPDFARVNWIAWVLVDCSRTEIEFFTLNFGSEQGAQNIKLVSLSWPLCTADIFF